MFTLTVDNEYTADQLQRAAKKMGYTMTYQWVWTENRTKRIVACDFFKTPKK